MARVTHHGDAAPGRSCPFGRVYHVGTEPPDGMANDPDQSADPIDRSEYELLRAKHGIFPLISVARKVRWCSYLSFAAALVAPIVALLPRPVREAYFAADPLSTSLGAATVVLFGTLCLGAGGVGLAALAIHLNRSPEPSGSEIWRLVGLEDAFTGIAFVTGALGVLAGIALLATGLTGVDRVETLIGYGITPYFPLPAYPVTPRLTAAVATVAGALTLGLAAFIDRNGTDPES